MCTKMLCFFLFTNLLGVYPLLVSIKLCQNNIMAAIINFFPSGNSEHHACMYVCLFSSYFCEAGFNQKMVKTSNHCVWYILILPINKFRFF